MTDPLYGHTALITGASKNIGAAIARTFADAGADLILVARAPDALETVAEDIRRESQVNVATVVADVGKSEDVDALLLALEVSKPIDVLVNNAYTDGNTFGTEIAEVPWLAWDKCIRVNLQGPIALAAAASRGMRERGKGSIINVVSPAAFQPVVGQAAYGASKAALWAFTMYIAREWAPEVRANALCPGTTTADPDHDPRMHIMSSVSERIPMGRLGSPNETAVAALWLASDASSYTTGQLLFVDGGRTTVG